jgi:hypothetical protein
VGVAIKNKNKQTWDRLSDDAMLHELQRDSFEYFLNESNPTNGLVRDRSKRDSAASIAAVGLALSVYPVGVERSFITRAEGIGRTLATLRFFRDSAQGIGSRATGYKGFYYHFLSLRTGRRVWDCELSTIDTAILLAGALVAASYFDRATAAEREIREIADELFGRVNWTWALAGGRTAAHGWKPRHGFLKYRWRGYSEGLLLYILGLGSPSYPLPADSYVSFTSGFRWKKYGPYSFLYAGPLFIHQLPQIWLDLRGLTDGYMRRRRTDYFENSRRATLVQQLYAAQNPARFMRYSVHCWGTTATDGPGNKTRYVNGRKRRFFGYLARGAPWGPDDGTIAPWAAVASLPFAPDIVLPTIRFLDGLRLRSRASYGFESSFNPTYAQRGNPNGWVSRSHYGLSQGPVVLMIENYRTGLIWELMRNCPYIVKGLRRARFEGGWLARNSAGNLQSR